MQKVLIQLNCSLDISNTKLEQNKVVETNHKRCQQIYDGLSKFFENKYDCDIIFTDNTIPQDKEIDQNIKDILTNNKVKIIHEWNNKFGSCNKGAGLIEEWIFIKDKLTKYDFILYFEPRLQLVNFDFINNFLENPRNLFVYGAGNNHFFTGLFGIKTSILLNYISLFNNKKDYRRLGSIEYHIYNYIKNNGKYDILEKAHVIWFDTVTKKEYLF